MLLQPCTTLGASTLLAATPRVFLSQTLPGWLNAERRIQLPLTMSERCTDIGVHIDDKEALADWVSRHTRFFASELPTFDLYPNETVYRSVVQPDWLQKARHRIDRTIAAYAPIASASRQLGPVFSLLTENWSEIRGLIAASLYMGEAGLSADHFYLTAQDLALFGEEIDSDSGLFPLIRLFDTAAHVTALLKSDMTDRIVIEGDEGPKDLYDAASEPSEPHVEVFDEAGCRSFLNKSELRPACIYEADAEGNIDPLAMGTADVHDAYMLFQKNLSRQNALLMGAYLLAHYRFEDGEAGRLCDRLATATSPGGDLFTSIATDIVRSHMRTTGRRIANDSDFHPEDVLPLRFLARALLWAGSIC